MPPKKRDREIEESKDTNFEQIQADHELFLQAFEKPTQIYRFLRTRNVIAPIFMHRTLTYMRHRMSRTHKNRKKFKVDQLLEKVVTQRQKDGQTESMKSGFLNITLTGFYDKCSKGYGSNDAVSVEALLLKICHKKRKLVGSGVTMATTCAVFLQDMASPVMQIAIGKADVPRNPDVNCSSQHATAISVPSDNFNLSNGHSVKSYVLLLKVHCPFWRTMPNGVYNGEFSDSDEPPPKKRKNGKLNHNEEDAVLYGAELVVFDKYQRCMLTDGDYELVLQDLGTKVLSRKHTSWETISDGKIIGPFEVFNKGPTLKFTLTWSTTPQNGPVSMPLPNIAHNDQTFLNNNQISDHITEKNNAVVKKPVSSCKPKKKMRIFYQFLYNNNTRQQTEARDDLHCPWCSLNCTQLYSLLKHLKLCHSRFIFTYVPHPKGARIDVSINECYDGSYSGNPQDVHSQTGYAFSRNGPVRRTPVTNAMVSRPKRLPPSLSEFLEADDTELEGSRPYITGHNRLYHHTKTCLPVRPQEIDNDSEAENDPEWLKTKTINMIDEFTDVNEGEKELMKLWNLHIMKHNFVGDCQIPRACEMFVTEHAKEMFEKNLCRNFILHMCSLYDFGLIAPNVIQRTVNLVRSLRPQSLPLQT